MELFLAFTTLSLMIYTVVRERMYHEELKFMTKLASGDPNPDRKEPLDPNPMSMKEDPNEIPLTDDRPFVFPKEFNLEVEGQEAPIQVTLQ